MNQRRAWKFKHHRQVQILRFQKRKLPDITAHAKKLMQQPGAEIIPEEDTEPEQGAEHN